MIYGNGDNEICPGVFMKIRRGRYGGIHDVSIRYGNGSEVLSFRNEIDRPVFTYGKYTSISANV